jgi:uridine kinase
MRYDELARAVLSRPAKFTHTRLVAIDGPSGSGKSYFAERFARAVRVCGSSVAVVHTDDVLDGWSDQFTFWEQLEQGVLQPLRRGEHGGFHPYDWVAAQRSTDWTVVPPAPVVMIEGCSSSRAVIRQELNLSVFVTAPQPVRVLRAVARDGGELLPFMDTWRAREEEFFVQDQTRRYADLIVNGAPDMSNYDRDAEFVIAAAG